MAPSEPIPSSPLPSSTTVLRGSDGQLIAWVAVALVNAGFLAALPATGLLRAGLRLELHLRAAGHLLALGVASYLVVRLWEALGRRIDRGVTLAVGMGALGLVASGAAWLVLRDDLSNFVMRLPGPPSLWRVALAVGFGLGLVAASLFARWLARKRWLMGVAAGLVITVVNQLPILLDYPGVHFLVTWVGAVVLGVSVAGRVVPHRLTPPRGLERPRLVAVAVTSILALVALAIIPKHDRVSATLFSAPGGVAEPLSLARDLDDDPEPPATASAVVDDAPSPTPPSGLGLADEAGTVLFITIDAVRRDLLVDEKYRKDLPTLWSLADDGVVFANARSATPATATTYQGMMTSRYHSQLYLTTKSKGKFKGAIAPFEDDSPTLPAELSEAKVHAAHAACLHRLVEGATGIGGWAEEETTRRNFGRASQLTKVILDLLRRNASRDRLFLYAHYVDPHAPYNRGGKDGTKFERYLKEVAVVDRELAVIRDFLKTSSRWKNTLLIVSADHGEAFGEHGRNYHASTVYEEVIAVPLIMTSPVLEHRVVAEPVSLIDMAPTILDWYGLPAPTTFMGQSLVPLMRGRQVDLTRPLIIDSGRRMQAMIFPDGIKAIRDLRRGTRELYDLKADPGEKNNLIDTPEAAERQAALAEFFGTHTERRPGYRVPWRKF